MTVKEGASPAAYCFLEGVTVTLRFCAEQAATAAEVVDALGSGLLLGSAACEGLALAEPVGEAVTSARALKFWNASAVAVALGTASLVLRF